MALSELAHILNNHFQVEANKNDLDSDSAYLDFLQMKLAKRVEFYINTDVEKLFQALYRIDVSQTETDKAFDLGGVSQISSKIAELIIKRQLRKLNYARQFSGD